MDYDDYLEQYPMPTDAMQQMELLARKHASEVLKDVIENAEAQKASAKRYSEDLSKANLRIRALEKDLKEADGRISKQKGFEFLRDYFKLTPEQFPELDRTYYIVDETGSEYRPCAVCGGKFKENVTTKYGEIEAKCKECYDGKQSWKTYTVRPAKINYIAMGNLEDTWGKPYVKVYVKNGESEYALETDWYRRRLFLTPEAAAEVVREKEKCIHEIKLPKAAQPVNQGE